MNFIDTWDKHKAEPDKSLREYYQELRVSLGYRLESRQKVYLDTKYWVMFRDVRMGRSQGQDVARLVEALSNAVSEGHVVCPITESTFIEVFKQSDERSLRATVALIDELSMGVALLSRFERDYMELLYLWLKHNAPSDSYYPPEVYAWTKLAYVLGFTYPTETPFSPEDERTMQKAFLDHMWALTLTDMLGVMGIQGGRDVPRFDDVSLMLNEGKFTHAEENISFKKMFMSEIAGGIDMMESAIYDLYERHCREHGLDTDRETPAAKEFCRQMRNVIYHGFRLNRFTTELPSLRIMAGLHAAIRWDKRRKYKANDQHDLLHAEAALPYHDLFLTERSLKSLVSGRNLEFPKLYTCRVEASPAEALGAFQEMMAEAEQT